MFRKLILTPVVLFMLAGSAHAGDVADVFTLDGEASWKGDRIVFETAIARWSEGYRDLNVGLFPFDTDEEDVKKALDYKMIFYATVGKPSPNPDRWEDPPYLLVVLKIKPGPGPYTEADVEAYTLNVTNWDGNKTTAIFLTGDDVGQVLKDLNFDPADIGSFTIELSETRDRDMLDGFRYKASVTP